MTNCEERLTKAREKIEAVIEEYEIENYVVIIDTEGVSFSTHSVDEDKIFGIIGFMDMLKYDLIQKLKEREAMLEGDAL